MAGPPAAVRVAGTIPLRPELVCSRARQTSGTDPFIWFSPAVVHAHLFAE